MNPSLNSIREHSALPVRCLAVLLLLFPVSGHALAGIVVCFEGSGRIEFESSRTGDCASSVFVLAREVHSDYGPTETKVVTDDECSSSCVDVLLFASPADGQGALTRSVESRSHSWNEIAPVSSTATIQEAPPHCVYEDVCGSDARACLTSPVSQIRTIVLLI